MKYFKRANVYKNSTDTNHFNPETFQAYSYDWWCYVKSFGGLKVFNTYRYSNTTAKHQANTRHLLVAELGENVDNYIRVECPKGLQSIEGLNSGIELYKSRIRELKELINKKGTHKAKNEERKELISEYKLKIKTIEQLIKGVS
jgi:hypothetical protein